MGVPGQLLVTPGLAEGDPCMMTWRARLASGSFRLLSVLSQTWPWAEPSPLACLPLPAPSSPGSVSR